MFRSTVVFLFTAFSVIFPDCKAGSECQDILAERDVTLPLPGSREAKTMEGVAERIGYVMDVTFTFNTDKIIKGVAADITRASHAITFFTATSTGATIGDCKFTVRNVWTTPTLTQTGWTTFTIPQESDYLLMAAGDVFGHYDTKPTSPAEGPIQYELGGPKITCLEVGMPAPSPGSVYQLRWDAPHIHYNRRFAVELITTQVLPHPAYITSRNQVLDLARHQVAAHHETECGVRCMMVGCVAFYMDLVRDNVCWLQYDTNDVIQYTEKTFKLCPGSNLR